MLRDKFAMAAMQGFCANLGFYSINDDVAERAYQMADAMMRERQNWDFSNDPDAKPTGTIESDTPIRRQAIPSEVPMPPRPPISYDGGIGFIPEPPPNRKG